MAGMTVAQMIELFVEQNAPLRIYSGDIAGAALMETIALQLFWLAALGAVGYIMQQRGLKRLSVAGG